VGGVTLSELNAIERKFVEILEWDLEVEYDRFSKYYGELVSHPAVCKECQLDTAPVEQKITTERPTTPKKSPKAASTSHSVTTTTTTKPPAPPPRKSSDKVKSALGKWTNSISHNLAATKSIFADLRPQGADEDRSSKKKPPRRDKENQSPGVEPMETNDASESFSELSLDETTTGPDTNSSPHWHNAINAMPAPDGLVTAM